MKIAIIGVYPPPSGGISLFIKRFCYYLEKRGIERVIYNTSPQKKSHYVPKRHILNILFDRSHIIHSNNIDIKSRMMIPFFRLFNKKAVLSVHGDSVKDQLIKLKGLSRKIYLHQIRKYDHIICVNPDTRQLLIENHINSNKITAIPAFIPPMPEETDIDNLPHQFGKIRKMHKWLITANASKVSFDKNKDTYGLDLSIELMKKLAEKGRNDVGFIFVISDIEDLQYFERMKNLLIKYSLEKTFHFYTEPVNYPAVIRLSDIFIRPTSSDGYGVSIAEAIGLGIPALASDVCKRPEGTVIFRSRDLDDMYNKATHIIENYNIYSEKIRDIKFEDNAGKIIEIYKKLLDR